MQRYPGKKQLKTSDGAGRHLERSPQMANYWSVVVLVLTDVWQQRGPRQPIRLKIIMPGWNLNRLEAYSVLKADGGEADPGENFF